MVETQIRTVLDTHADEATFVASVVKTYSITLPQFDFDPEHIKKTEEYDQVSGQLQSIFPGQMMRVWVVNFGFSYTGDIDYLRYIPRAGATLSTPAFTYDAGYVWLRTWTPDGPNRDLQKIKAEKEQAIAFLQKRVEDAAPELEAFNQQLPAVVQTLFASLKQKYQQDKDILMQL